MAESQGHAAPVTADLCWMSASELARAIRRGEVSAREAVAAHIRRIEAVNPALNAVVVPLFEEALAAADAADAARAAGAELGPLHGVPVTIKDQFAVAGTPATWGLPSRARTISRADGPLVARLRRAGAIILGKTNVPQLLAYNESVNPLYGRTKNPWNPLRTPGGSSGGEASIVAAGGSSLGLGADLGGSLRLPAHFCGLAALKCTSERLTNLDSPPELYGWGQEAVAMQPGPLARTVEDVALALRVLAAPGLAEVDPAVAPVAWREAAEVRVEGLRIALYVDDGVFPAAPAVRRVVREAAEALRARGLVVEEWTPPDVFYAMRLFARLIAGYSGSYTRKLVAHNRRDPRIASFLRVVGIPNAVRPAIGVLLRASSQPNLADFVLNLRPFSADQYLEFVAERARYRDRFVAIICPPHALPALTHEGSTYLMGAGSYSFLYNLLGMPAGVVPASRVRPGEESDRVVHRDIVERAAARVERASAGLPVGVQVAARHWREDVALAVMGVLEEHFRQGPLYPARPVIEAGAGRAGA
jgi:fatty acid amide hydrolase